MPITKSAIKKLRVDKRRVLINRPVKARMKTALKNARANPTPETISKLYSALDRAVKTNITTRNTAARLKARLAKSMKDKKLESPFGKKAVKPTTAKKVVKKPVKASK